MVCIGEALALVPDLPEAGAPMPDPPLLAGAEANVAAALAAAVVAAAWVGRIGCAPVRSASGRAVAAVSVSVPDIVLTYERLLELLPSLLTVTEKISRDCGWTGEGGRGVRLDQAVELKSPGRVRRVAGSDTSKGHSA